VLLGGFAALTGQITLDAIGTAVRERFPGAVGDRNMAAAAAAFRFVTLEEEEMVHASTD
jgi:pyruvate ferredoxin oxidoreductase gamma subunit